MTPEELKQITDSVTVSFEDTIGAHSQTIQTAIKEHTNGDDHRFVKTMRDKEKRKQEMWQKVQSSVIGTVVLGCIGGIGTAVYSYFIKNPQ